MASVLRFLDGFLNGARNVGPSGFRGVVVEISSEEDHSKIYRKMLAKISFDTCYN